MTSTPSPSESFEQLAVFLAGGRLTQVVADLEHELVGSDAAAVAAAAQHADLDDSLLTAALLVRRHMGRLNDLIHTSAICLALPAILESNERLTNRPSLAAGNDASRPFDIETDRRIAEFKLGLWTGRDAMRKRGVFHDLVHLASDNSGRRADLYVAGPAPLRFLRNSRSTASWALNRGADSTRSLFLDRFGTLDMLIRDFTAGPAAHVRLVDLADLLPQVRDAL